MLKYGQNKRYVFFMRAESHVKGVKIFFEKNRFLSFKVNVAVTTTAHKLGAYP